MSDAKKQDVGQRIGLILRPELLSAIDDYRYSARFPTRTGAIEDLLRAGLDARAQAGK